MKLRYVIETPHGFESIDCDEFTTNSLGDAVFRDKRGRVLALIPRDQYVRVTFSTEMDEPEIRNLAESSGP